MKPEVRPDDARFLELLDRWLRGDFTRADERELHVLTGSDEFRREAWEGLSAAPEEDHATRLSALRRHLLDQAPGRRTVLFPQWMAAAAALVLLVAAVWIFNPWKQKPDTPLAGVTQETSPGAPENIPPAEAPIASNNDQAQPQPGAASENSAGKRRTETTPISSPLAYSDDEKEAMKQQEADLAQTSEAEEAIDKMAAAKPVPTQPASVASAPAGAPATARDESAKKSKTLPSRALDSTRWFKTDDRPDMDAVKKVAEEKAQPEPAGGWDAFHEYIRQNARLTPEARNHNISGSVQVQFTVNDNGEAVNFVIVKSLGYGCDQEAIRLVKEWDWSAGQAPLTVDIKFVR